MSERNGRITREGKEEKRKERLKERRER
jgi:hypothetical protein